jgi:simple sugar transport system substrate-binding protein
MRAEGFFKSMPAGTKTTKLATGEDPEKFKDILRSFLTQNTDVEAIFTFTMCNKWVVDVLQEMNLLDKIKLLTADESPSSLEGILQGYYLATFSQAFAIQGQLAYNTMYLYKETGMCPIQPLITGPAVIDSSNAQKVKELAIGALGQEAYDKLSPFTK